MGKMLFLIHADPFGYSDRGYGGQTVPVLFVLGCLCLGCGRVVVVFLWPGCGLEFIYDWYAG